VATERSRADRAGIVELPRRRMSAARDPVDCAFRGVDVLVAGALTWELRPVLAALADVRREPAHAGALWSGRAGRYRVRVVRTGIGATAATRVMDYACARDREGPPRFIVSTGCAGGLVQGLEAGTLVVATAIVDANRAGAGVAAPVVAALLEWAAADDMMLLAGGFYCARRPLLRATAKRAAHDRSGALVVEMEGRPIAAVSAAVGATFVAVRAVLDALETDLSPLAAVLARRAEPPPALAPATRSTRRGPWGALVVDRRAAERALARFFGRFFFDGRGIAALERAVADGGPV
jgi:uridine phosphorylase